MCISSAISKHGYLTLAPPQNHYRYDTNLMFASKEEQADHAAPQRAFEVDTIAWHVAHGISDFSDKDVRYIRELETGILHSSRHVYEFISEQTHLISNVLVPTRAMKAVLQEQIEDASGEFLEPLNVRRHMNWNNQRPDLKEDLAHLVQDIKRRICNVASAGLPSFSV
jgi:hypothetical protein